MSEVPVTAELLQRLQVDSSIPLPDPSKVPHVDLTRTEKWINEGFDENNRAIRTALVNGIEYISFPRFLGAIEVAIGDIKGALGRNPYAVIFGEKPHSSQYWVYSLMKNSLPDPAFTTYFKGNFTSVEIEDIKKRNLEKILDEKKPLLIPETTDMEKLSNVFEEKDIHTFLFVDDIAYSAKQMFDAVRRFVYSLKEKSPTRKLKVVVFVPASTRRLEILLGEPHIHPFSDITQDLKDAEIVVIPAPINLKTTGETLTEAGLRRPTRLNLADERMLPIDACLAYADHKVPDHWSFPNQVSVYVMPSRYGINESELVPYKRPGTEYFNSEDEEFAQYVERFI